MLKTSLKNNFISLTKLFKYLQIKIRPAYAGLIFVRLSDVFMCTCGEAIKIRNSNEFLNKRGFCFLSIFSVWEN